MNAYPTDLLIDGEFVKGGGEAERVLNPATAEPLASVPEADPGQIERAVRAAARAFDAWSETAPAERAKLLLDKTEGKVENITGPIVTSAAQAGDEIAIDAFGQIGYWLGQGLADLVQILDPQVLVVGGGVIDAGDLLMTPARQSYLDSLAQRGRLPVAELRAAKMGNTAGLIGAADLARQ